MKNLPTFCNDSSFAVQFTNSVSKTRAILLFTIKIIEICELHASMPPMQSAEYQATIPLKFLIIIHNYANVQTINQSKSLTGFWVVVTSSDSMNGQSILTLLRGENDSKQSHGIQAIPYFPTGWFPKISIPYGGHLEFLKGGWGLMDWNSKWVGGRGGFCSRLPEGYYSFANQAQTVIVHLDTKSKSKQSTRGASVYILHVRLVI